MRVLTGDIGGTKTLLALADVDGTRVRVVAEERFASADFPSLTHIVARFLAVKGGRGMPACFGVAGPVLDDTCKATNLPWVIDARALERELGLGPTRLINDFQAAAYGIECVAPGDVVTVHEGTEITHAPRAVLGAGTGLGEAILYWSGDHYEVLPTEGGHCEFAPRDEVEMSLLRALIAHYGGHVSYERVVSGMGLVHAYDHLRASGFADESPAVSAEMKSTDDRAAVIGQHAVAGDDPLCAMAFDLFASAYGAEAGNLGLKVLARGGIYLAGGIAAKVLPRLVKSPFLKSLHDKGRLSDVVRAMPVRVVTEARLGLFGAAAHAGRIG
jgi:glucokinase